MGETADVRLANLVLAGVTKAGTTSLYSYLAQHPDVFVPATKELNHFSPLVHGQAPGDLASYAAHFRDAGHEPWRLDASPFYFVGGAPLAAAVDETLHDARVLVVVRSPVDRLWSSFTYKKSKGHVPRSAAFAEFFEACVEHAERGTDLDPENSNFLTLRSGRYADFLPAWADRFGDRLRLLFAERLAAEPEQVMRDTFDWLGVAGSSVGDLDYGRRNATQTTRSVRVRRLADRANRRLKPVTESNPALRSALRRLYAASNTSAPTERMTPEDRERVAAYYEPSVARLRELLRGRGYDDLPAWLAG
jgi:hypothetical protein